MTTKTSIFLTGATGYIGGAVLTRLLTHPRAPNFDITALVRSETKGKVLQEKFGVRPLVGSLQDADKITAASENANVVINTADCDDLPSAEAILAGMKARHDKTGEVPVLIHTSGTAMLIDDARGAYRSETIYDDMNLEQVKSIPPSALHRHVDIPIVDADVAGYVRAYIVAPSMIYGAAKNALVDAGVANPFSIAVPGMVRVAIKRGRPMVIGEGKSGWPIVHINDTAEFYIQLFDAISARPDTVGHGEEGLYFLENGESPWSAVARSIGRAMVATGVVSGPEPEPESLTTSEQMAEVCGSEFRGRILGSNCRCKARRARAQVGWKPKFEVDDFNASTEEDFRKVFEAEKK
ncbi:NAD(P)-binding protein [Epithele typhae]|uniref:NAD(P)-binding protein n=1 Tax=Epithele typhae TaxID=378194 RepID=UPI0020074671|nr:NAD(P)-binding protein [Epithele typhae]KAH9944977.1 NAD(P)-binding protein [Epithele typhae]